MLHLLATICKLSLAHFLEIFVKAFGNSVISPALLIWLSILTKVPSSSAKFLSPRPKANGSK